MSTSSFVVCVPVHLSVEELKLQILTVTSEDILHNKYQDPSEGISHLEIKLLNSKSYTASKPAYVPSAAHRVTPIQSETVGALICRSMTRLYEKNKLASFSSLMSTLT